MEVDFTKHLIGELLAALDVGVVVCDARAPDQPIVRVNPGFERLTGYSAHDAVGRNCRFLQGDGTSRLVKTVLRDATDTGGTVTATALNYRSDGSSFWNEIQLIPLALVGGAPTYYVGLMKDVSERVDAESNFEHTEILRSTAFNSMVEGILVLDSTGSVSDAGPASVPGARPVLDARLLVRRRDGVDRLISFNYEPVYGRTSDHPQGMVVSFIDVTDRERSEVDLQQFASLVEISNDFIAIAGLDGDVSYLNPAGRQMVGLASLEEARAAKIRDFLTDDGWRASIETEQPAEPGALRGPLPESAGADVRLAARGR